MEIFNIVTPYCMMTQLALMDIFTCGCVNNILLVTTITVNHVIL